MSTILIVGGGGFLASHIQMHYRSLGWRVVEVGRRATANGSDGLHSWTVPHPEFAGLLTREKPDICVNAAGRASVSDSIQDPRQDFEASVDLNSYLLDLLRLSSPNTTYIHLSSAAVYGNPSKLPVREDAPVAPISPYGWHKYLSELVLLEYARQFGIRTASLRIFSAYGAMLRRQVVWELATRLASSPKEALVVQGLGSDSRDFIHGSDVARAVQFVSARGALAGETYNVASGAETSMSTLASLILQVSGRTVPISFDAQQRIGSPNRWHADISALADLGFSPLETLESGVRSVVAAAGSYVAR